MLRKPHSCLCHATVTPYIGEARITQVTFLKNKGTDHKRGKIIYDLSKHHNLSCNKCLHEMSSKG